MKSMKTFVAAAIAASAIVATVPVVNAQGTAAATSTQSVRAANRQLAKQVMMALHTHKGMEWSDVMAVARSGKVTLVGMARDQAQIDLAGKVAEGVPGVMSVTNNLTVDEGGGGH